MRSIVFDGLQTTSKIMLGVPAARIGDLIEARKAVIVTDSRVWALHGHLLSDCKVVKVPPGEQSKTLTTVNAIYEDLLQEGIDRSSFIIGFGGGVVCDMAGFVASTYLRGLPFAFIPTTLLAQVDASVGGKNGVNLNGY